MAKLYTSAGSAYFSLARTSGAIHCTVPQFPVIVAELVNAFSLRVLRHDGAAQK